MSRVGIIIALVLGVASPALAHEPPMADATGPDTRMHFSAMNWLCWNGPEACYGYARGVADTLVLSGQACIPPQTDTKELATVGKEFVDHLYNDEQVPGEPGYDDALDDSAGKLLIMAFMKKWPCTQS